MASLLQVPILYTSALQNTPRTINSTINAGGTNICVALCFGLEDAGTSIVSVTWNTTESLVKLDSVAASSFSRAEIWYLVAPSTGTHDFIVTTSGLEHFNFAAYVAQNVNQSTPLRTAVKTAADSGTSASDTVASVGASDLVIDALDVDNTGHSLVVGADQTKDLDGDSGAGSTSTGASSQLGSAGGVMSWTWTTSGPNSHIASAFIDDGTGGGPSTPVPTLIVNQGNRW